MVHVNILIIKIYSRMYIFFKSYLKTNCKFLHSSQTHTKNHKYKHVARKPINIRLYITLKSKTIKIVIVIR